MTKESPDRAMGVSGFKQKPKFVEERRRSGRVLSLALSALVSVGAFLWHKYDNATPQGDTVSFEQGDEQAPYSISMQNKLKELIHDQARASLAIRMLQEDIERAFKKDLKERIKYFRDRGLFNNMLKKIDIDGKKLSKFEYIKSSVDKYDFPLILDGAKKYLKELIPFLVAQESRFDESRTSRSGAVGLWQLMPGTVKDNVVLEEEKRLHADQIQIPFEVQDKMELAKDIYWASKIALNHIGKRIPRTLNKELDKLRATLDMPEDNFYRFYALVIVNSYNAGQGTVKKCLRSFREHLQSLKETASRSRDLNDLRKWKLYKGANTDTLFALFLEYAKRADKRFGSDANGYTRQILAARQALGQMSRKTKTPRI